jgi:Ca2+-binding EF-hand superfamily protein
LALDPDTIGHVDLKKFCPLFESIELKKMRLNRILDSIATQFYMKNFNLRKAFSVFDLNKTGKVSSKHFRQALLQLDLALSYEEVEDLLSMIDTYSN